MISASASGLSWWTALRRYLRHVLETYALINFCLLFLDFNFFSRRAWEALRETSLGASFEWSGWAPGDKAQEWKGRERKTAPQAQSLIWLAKCEELSETAGFTDSLTGLNSMLDCQDLRISSSEPKHFMESCYDGFAEAAQRDRVENQPRRRLTQNVTRM